MEYAAFNTINTCFPHVMDNKQQYIDLTLMLIHRMIQ